MACNSNARQTAIFGEMKSSARPRHARFIACWLSADQSLPSWEAQVHTETLGNGEGEEQHAQERQHEDGSYLASRE